MIKIFNGNSEALISEETIEIVSLKNNGTEFLYQRDGGWPQTSPILFPICGRLKDDKFIYDNKIYNLEKHGFLRNFNHWKIVSKKDDSVEFETSWNKETIIKYPFKFSIVAKFELLTENEIQISLKIINEDTQEIYYSIGFHPAFIVTKDGQISLNEEEEFFHNFEEGLKAVEQEYIKLKDFKVSDIKWNSDLCLASNTFQTEMVSYQDAQKEFSINTKEFDVFCFWSKDSDNKWLCFEPWKGFPDKVEQEIKEISEKPHIQSLAINKSKVTSLNINFKAK
ncbi:hypothetical protein [Spiroplasma endosymbiont of Crioceris asparagi]|uniref:aldose epimerase family protein n=1 Tax=Spiroplasma endosymbiont of Crioceris asparagi TaxID=3066286 RepID=UPI0030CB70AC